jgi:hypothetical protein
LEDNIKTVIKHRRHVVWNGFSWLRISSTAVFMSVTMNIRVIYLRQEISWKNTWLTTSRDELHILRMFTDAVTDTWVIEYGMANENIFVNYDF